MADQAAATPASEDDTRFHGDLAASPQLPRESIDAADRLLSEGRLFRYGEAGRDPSEAALLEEEFAATLGADFCVAVNSCGCAIFLALAAAGATSSDTVLINAFTLAPAVGAIAHLGARPALVDINDNLTVDVDDLRAKAAQTGARYLILSYMRGHIADMDAVHDVCREFGLTMIEDCAHATLARWDGKLIGRFGAAGCFSAQGYKHMNGGEGGLIVTDDPDLAARVILMSGSYMLYAQHRARPDLEVFDRWRATTPNFSMRMNDIAAAVLRPQLRDLGARVERWRAIYDRIAGHLARSQHIRLPQPDARTYQTPTSIQFLLQGMAEDRIERAVAGAAERGVAIKWFGAGAPVGFTSRPDHWAFVPGNQTPPNAARLLSVLCDVRLPVGLSDAECDQIGEIVVDAVAAAAE